MLRLKDIDHIVLSVHDMQPMIDFYCSLIGCVVEGRRPDSSLVHLRAGSSIIDLMLDNAFRSGGSNMHHFCLNVEDFEPKAVKQELESRGVKVGNVTSRNSIFLSDPEGNRVEL